MFRVCVTYALTGEAGEGLGRDDVDTDKAGRMVKDWWQFFVENSFVASAALPTVQGLRELLRVGSVGGWDFVRGWVGGEEIFLRACEDAARRGLGEVSKGATQGYFRKARRR